MKTPAPCSPPTPTLPSCHPGPAQHTKRLMQILCLTQGPTWPPGWPPGGPGSWSHPHPACFTGLANTGTCAVCNKESTWQPVLGSHSPSRSPASCPRRAEGHQPGSATRVPLPSTWPLVEPPELARRLSTPLIPPPVAFYRIHAVSVPDTPKWNLPNECLSEAGGSRRAGGLASLRLCVAGSLSPAQPRASGLRAMHFHRVLREVRVGLREDQECRARPR